MDSTFKLVQNNRIHALIHCDRLEEEGYPPLLVSGLRSMYSDSLLFDLSGYGDGYGDGDGYGNGDGYGYGDGYGNGYGDGDGYGNGDGYGYGDY